MFKLLPSSLIKANGRTSPKSQRALTTAGCDGGDVQCQVSEQARSVPLPQFRLRCLVSTYVTHLILLYLQPPKLPDGDGVPPQRPGMLKAKKDLSSVGEDDLGPTLRGTIRRDDALPCEELPSRGISSTS